MHKSLIILAILAIGGALYLGSAVLIPIALAIYGAILLTPLTDRFCRWGFARIAAAGGVMLTLAVLIGILINFTLDPAREWIDRAPTVFKEIELKLRPLQKAAGQLGRVAEHAERLAGTVPQNAASAPAVAPVPVTGGGVLIKGVGILVPVIGTFFMMFFFLAFGPPILYRMASNRVNHTSGRRLLVIVERTRREMGRYLATLTLINVVLGFATAGICMLFELPNPVLWGVMAAVFNFVPYAGSATTLVVLTVVALLTHGLGTAAAVGGSYLLLDTLEGQLVQPLMVGKRLSLNPLAIFLALWIGAGLWGLVGMLLATPILLTVRIICRRIPSCRLISDFLAPVRERPLVSRARAWRRQRRRTRRARTKHISPALKAR